MNCRTTKIIIPALMAMLLGLAGERPASASCTAISGAFLIASSGCYTVMGDIQVTSGSNSGSACNPSGNTGVGICINTGVSNVAIDLNGHTILATGSGAAAAISDGGTSAARVTVKNGIIDGSTFGFTVAGVLATGANARAERLQVRNSGSGNGTVGGYGIRLGNAAVAVKNVVANSLLANPNTTAIACGTDCVISRNVANFSGSSATGTTGISTGNGGLIEENAVIGNATGLSLGTSTGFGEDVLMNSTNRSGGTNMGQNICNGLLSPPASC